MKRLLAIASMILLPSLAMAEMTGNPMVMNGDTMQFGEQQVSLYGVHAPMITQTCGETDDVWSCGWDAAIHLEDVIAGREVVCTDLTDIGEVGDEGMHYVGRCTAEGDDLSAAMVEAGFAIPDEEMGEAYVASAIAAEEEGIGLWSGPFVDPVTYAQNGGCSCSARKKSMMENAELLEEMRAEEEATETN